MDIKELKTSIESKTIDDKSIVFVCDNSFIPQQYIREIAKIKNKKIAYVDDISFLKHKNPFVKHNDIYVYKTDTFSDNDFNLTLVSNLYIICKKCKISTDNTVAIPKIESWQIEDYISSQLPALSAEAVKFIKDATKEDIFRVAIEIDRLKIFTNAQTAFNDFKDAGVYSDIATESIIDFINAIENKNVNTVAAILNKLSAVDIEPLGVVTLLYNVFRKMLIIITTRNPDENNTGIKSGQIWALKKVASNYTGNQILEIFQFLGTLQKGLVEGTIPADILLDYTVLNVLSKGR